jgi:hypothetical protein
MSNYLPLAFLSGRRGKTRGSPTHQLTGLLSGGTLRADDGAGEEEGAQTEQRGGLGLVAPRRLWRLTAGRHARAACQCLFWSSIGAAHQHVAKPCVRMAGALLWGAR